MDEITVESGPLADAYAKLTWADVHVDRLVAEIGEVGEIPTRPVTAEDGLDYPYDHLRKILIPEIPGHLAFIVGDAVHNIRTALDYLMSALAFQNGKSGRHPTFPICESREQLEKHKSMRFVSPSARAFIESQCPYKGGCDVLWWLHRIDIIDKHRKLSLLEHGPPISVFVKGRHSGRGAWYMTPNYWLEQDSGAPRQSVVDLIQEMRESVKGILDSASATFFPS